MTTDTLRCPRCEYENIVLTCGFCIQCGADLSHLVSEPAIAAPAHATALRGAHGDDDSNVTNTLVTNGARLLGVEPKRSRAGWRFTLQTRSSRKQTIHVLVDDKKNNGEIICFLSICGPAVVDNASTLLEWNAHLAGCAFAVRTINGERMSVLTANLPVRMLDAALFAETAHKIAERADQVEEKFGSGADKY